MRHVLLLGVGVLLSISISHADPPRYSRKPSIAIDVTRTERTRPVRAREAAKARPITADDVLRSHRHVEPLRRKQEALLEKLVRDTPDDDPEKPDHLFRLAEHYAQQLRLWRIQAVEETLRR